MKNVLRSVLLPLALTSGFFLAGCDDDDSVMSPAAPLETATPTATPSATPSPTATPGDADVGKIVGVVGRIQAITGTQHLQVAGEQIATNNQTRFVRNGDPSSFDAFSVGEDVRVAGSLLADGTILATKVSLSS
jgi:hypothetical protein